MKPYAVYKSNGKLWKAGHGIFGLCSSYNHATNPATPMGDNEHKRSFAYARAIKNRMKKKGFIFGVHYVELNDGSLFPQKRA